VPETRIGSRSWAEASSPALFRLFRLIQASSFSIVSSSRGSSTALGSVDRDRDPIASLLEPPREHVAVHFLVFYEQNLLLLEGALELAA